MRMRKKKAVISTAFVIGLCWIIPIRGMACKHHRPHQEKLAAQIDAMMSEAFRPDTPGSALLVMQGGKTIIRKGYGMANMELEVPASPDMIFWCGSMTKMFTATAIMQLEERGALDYADPISKFLDDSPTTWSHVTVEHLLSHTSGIIDIFKIPSWMSRWKDDITPKELIAFFKKKPFEFEPGIKGAYSNSNYILLGQILEKVSGIPLEKFVQEQILDPLGLKDTRFFVANDELVSKRAKGYILYPDGRLGLPPYISTTHAYGAGTLYSSVDDLGKFAAALDAGDILKPQTVEKAFTPRKLKNGELSPYGFGNLFWFEEGLPPIIRISGSAVGYEAYSLFSRETDTYVVILTNVSAYPGIKNPYFPGTMVKRITRLLLNDQKD